MLHHHDIGQVTREHRAQREGEAGAHRLVLEVRGRRERRAWRRELAKRFDRLLGQFAAPPGRPGPTC